MGQRRTSGHSITIGAETYARSILAAKAVGLTIGEFTERSLLASIGRQEQWSQERRFEEACRVASEQRRPNPMKHDYVKSGKDQ